MASKHAPGLASLADDGATRAFTLIAAALSRTAIPTVRRWLADPASVKPASAQRITAVLPRVYEVLGGAPTELEPAAQQSDEKASA